jgi:hypothetical protein
MFIILSPLFLHYSINHCCNRNKRCFCISLGFFAAPNIVVHVLAVPQHPAIDMITKFLFQHHSTLLLHQLTSVEVAAMIAGCRTAILGVVQLLSVVVIVVLVPLCPGDLDNDITRSWGHLRLCHCCW